MSLAAPRQNRLFRAAQLVALWAMLVPLLASFAQNMPVLAMEGMPECHMAGMVDDGHAKNSDHGKAPACPICQTMQILAQGFVSPVVASLAVFDRDAVIVAALPEPQISFTTYVAAWPRAPPVLA